MQFYDDSDDEEDKFEFVPTLIQKFLEFNNISRSHPKYQQIVSVLISIKWFEEEAIRKKFYLDKYYFYKK